jgi:hypothetical protein
MLGVTQIFNLMVYEGREVLSKPGLPGLLPPCLHAFAFESESDYRVELRPFLLLQRAYAQLKLGGREKPERLEAHVHESKVFDVVQGLRQRQARPASVQSLQRLPNPLTIPPHDILGVLIGNRSISSTAQK